MVAIVRTNFFTIVAGLMHSTQLRREHIHGVLLGVAVGEALGYARRGLSSRRALKIYGRPKASYEFSRGFGIYGENTRLMLLNAQALLNSRNELAILRPAFRWRLRWYLLGIPPGSSYDTLEAAARSWLARLKIESGIHSTSPTPAVRAIFSAPTLHGTGHRLPRWTEESTKLTHTHPMTIECCKILASLASLGCTSPSGLSPKRVLEAVVEATNQWEIKEKLEQLTPFLEQHRSSKAVARHFGWKNKIDSHIVPLTVMGAYCWLRHPDDFRRAVISAISLGGDTTTLGAIVGGLYGAHSGASGIPKDLVAKLSGSPHGPKWIAELAKRFAHWPHGAEDLYSAPAQASYPLQQLARNLLLNAMNVPHLVPRLLNKD